MQKALEKLLENIANLFKVKTKEDAIDFIKTYCKV